MNHWKTICDANRPKDMEEYDFEVPERLRETLAPSSIPPDAVLAMVHSPEEEFVDPIDLETEFFSEPEPEKTFSSPGTLQSLCCKRDQNTILYPCERPNFTCPD